VRAPRAASTLAIVAALAVGHAVTNRLNVTGLESPAFVRSADLAQVAHLSYADVEVTDVRPAQYLAPPVSDDLAVKAGGVWLLVSLTATATREPTLLVDGRLVDEEGRVYRSSTRSGCAFVTHTYTGLPNHSVFCFDVPTDVLAGLHFVIARGDLDNARLAGDDLAEVDLGISRSEAASWARTTKAYNAESEDLAPIELQEITLNQVGS